MRTVIVLALVAATVFTSSKSNANDIFIDAFGDSYEMQIIQKNGSDNDFDLNAIDGEHILDVVQDGNNNSANVTLSGSNPTSITLNQTGDNLGYTLTHICTNPGIDGYCHVIVTQN